LGIIELNAQSTLSNLQGMIDDLSDAYKSLELINGTIAQINSSWEGDAKTTWVNGMNEVINYIETDFYDIGQIMEAVNTALESLSVTMEEVKSLLETKII